MSRDLKFAIVGAGNGGQSMAGDLTLRGFNVVSLYDRFPEALKHVQNQGGIKMIGDVCSGFARIPLITTDIGEAVKDADVIMVVVPAFAHEYIAEALAPHVKASQVVVLNPGYFGGTIVFRNIFTKHGVKCPILAETMILLYATRIVGPGVVGIQDIKRWLPIAALPASRTDEVLEMLRPAFPQLAAADSVLETGINNPNPVIHVPTTLLNWGRTHSEGQASNFEFSEWITPPIKPIVDMVDKERLAVANAAGVKGISHDDFVKLSYGGRKKDVVQRVGEVPPSATIVPERYITEDVPTGLVPLVSLGEMLGVRMPVTRLMIELAGVIKGIDYWKEGRTLERLGLGNLDIEGIKAFVK